MQVSSSEEPQILLILIGLPGSGKTTLSASLAELSPIPIVPPLDHIPRYPQPDSTLSSSASNASVAPVIRGRRWIRASQDDAPSRRRQECEAMVMNGLKEGCNVVVDRVGFDPVQRSHFIRLARTHFPLVQIYALTLHASPETLRARLLARPSHPTLTNPELALQVLEQMTRAFDPPRPGRKEGFDRVLEMYEVDQPGGGCWTEEGLGRLIRDLKGGYEEVGPAIESGWAHGRGIARGDMGRGRGMGIREHNPQGRGGVHSGRTISPISSSGLAPVTLTSPIQPNANA